MYGQTVHRPLERVNTLCRVSSEATPGGRLKAYIEARWGRRMGGMEALAQAAKLRGRQTLYEWFAGGEPSLAALGQVADALGVRRVDLVAAYDGVTAPVTEETPRPDWAEGLADEVSMKVVTLLGGPEFPAALELLRERLAGTQPLPHEADGGGVEGPDPGTGAPPGRRVG
jgi:hypothetical protein